MHNNPDILVTGPDGFVGTAICSRLIEKGNRVRAAQWQDLPLSRGCHSVVVGNIGPATDWGAALQGIDTVLHLAARVHVMQDTATDPMAAFRSVNTEGTKHLAKCAAKAGIRRFVFLSSAKVNGEKTETRPFSESDKPNPGDPYAISKWEAEQALLEIAEKTDMDVTIIRSPLVYGPGVKANFLKLVNAVYKGIPLPFASIHNSRSLISLDNLVSALIACIKHPLAAGETFLVSDGNDVSTPDLVRRIGTALGRPAKLIPIPAIILNISGRIVGKHEMIRRISESLILDISKIQRVLDWTPPSTMDEELARIAAWYMEQKQ